MNQLSDPRNNAFDELTRRRVAIRNAAIARNRNGWAAINAEEKRLGWASIFYRPILPPALPPPLERDIELRAIELGIG